MSLHMFLALKFKACIFDGTRESFLFVVRQENEFFLFFEINGVDFIGLTKNRW